MMPDGVAEKIKNPGTAYSKYYRLCPVSVSGIIILECLFKEDSLRGGKFYTILKI